MMTVYYILAACIVIISLLFSKYRRVGAALIIVMLTLFAGSRYWIDNDHLMYFQDFRNAARSWILDRDYEASMMLIPKIGSIFFYKTQHVVNFSFMAFAFLGVYTKVTAMRKYSDYFFLSIALYVSYLFLMQEMTTVRAGVASGIFLLLLPELSDKKYTSYFIKIWAALLFHYTAFVFVLIGLVVSLKIHIRYYLIALGASFLIILLDLNILTLLFLDRIPQVAVYLEIMKWANEEAINIWNFRILMSIFFLFIFIIKYEKMKNVKYFDVLFKTHIISLILFFSLSTTAMVFSARTFDLISIIQVLLFPMIVKVFPPKLRVIPYAIIIIFAGVQIYYLLEVGELLRPYQSWIF